jgi:hypothetical protein
MTKDEKLFAYYEIEIIMNNGEYKDNSLKAKVDFYDRNNENLHRTQNNKF